MNKKEIKELIKVFADKTGCDIQYNGCPCNSCFHSIDELNGTDFKHLCWLIILSLRGDYEFKETLKLIKEELNPSGTCEHSFVDKNNDNKSSCRFCGVEE